jgi:hypothetical protein
MLINTYFKRRRVILLKGNLESRGYRLYFIPLNFIKREVIPLFLITLRVRDIIILFILLKAAK